MTVAVTLESRLIAPAQRALEAVVLRHASGHAATARLDILEGVSARVGGFSLSCFRELFPQQRQLREETVVEAAEGLAVAVRALPMPSPLAIAALAQPSVHSLERRWAGAYYTDFRLARYVAKLVTADLPPHGLVLDPACGSGILLAAVIDQLVANGDEPSRALDRVAGVDLSVHALRSALITMASFTSDLGAVRRASERLRASDSLTATTAFWTELAPNGIAAVVTNPPWEKLKLSRHEVLKQAGVERHYGADYDDDRLASLDLPGQRARLRAYSNDLGVRFAYQGSGEGDLYKLFVELAFSVVCSTGMIALIVPGGLIRSRGAASLRALVFDAAESLAITVFENRARFFAIDTRFKFLVLHARAGSTNGRPLSLVHAAGTAGDIEERSRAEMSRRDLMHIRADLSVPEVRSTHEWALFKHMVSVGRPLDGSDAHWRMDIVRELDMTNDRPLFETRHRPGWSPVVEGRMVHQYRYGAKSYQSGTGRKAAWGVLPVGHGPGIPHYWVPLSRLPVGLRRRVGRHRLGFCDITGQTNERSMLAALIPSGVVCGNKVPTVVLDVPPREEDDAVALWLAIANSLSFDWLLRRVVTTSLNFFVLRSLAFPPVWVSDPPGLTLARLARQVLDADAPGADVDEWLLGAWRAEIDARVAFAWGLSWDDVELILKDFPLIDRGQPVLPGEPRSTVTADLFRLAFAMRLDNGSQSEVATLRERVAAIRQLGACGYQPSEHVAYLRRQQRG